MKRMWPEEYAYILDNAEEVTLDAPAYVAKDGVQHDEIHRQALKIRIAEQDFERIWPLAEARYRLGGNFAGKAITLIANNPHYHTWHPADGGSVDTVSDSGVKHTTKYVVAYLLLDEVREAAVAA
jgi:hypothetical protein